MKRLTPLLCAITLAACSSVTHVYDDVMGRGTEQPVAGRFYVGRDALPLYAEPSFSSEQVAELSLHQAVHREKLDRGFAYVTVVGTPHAGWLDNARLLWRLPRDEAVAPAAAPAPAPTPIREAEQTEPAVESEPPPPAEPAAAKPADPGDGDRVNPALFDAF